MRRRGRFHPPPPPQISGTRCHPAVPHRLRPHPQPSSKSFTSAGVRRCSLGIFSARSAAKGAASPCLASCWGSSLANLSRPRSQTELESYFLPSVSNKLIFFPYSLQACPSFYLRAVCGWRKLYKPQGMTCMLGLTVSSQEKSRMFFWSRSLNSSSPEVVSISPSCSL